MKIDPQSIERVRETANIVEVASEFTALRRQGARYTGLCPFPDHSEKTPSFSVTPDKGFYYCFGCLEENELIWTSRGLIPIAAAEPGDRVIGLDGRSEVITEKVFRSGTTLSIETGAAKEGIDLTLDHWCVFVQKEEALRAISAVHLRHSGGKELRFSSKLRGRNVNARLSIEHASEIRAGDFWLYPVIPSEDRADTHLRGEHAIKLYTKGPQTPRISSLPVNPDTAWLYGVWLAEGSLYRGGVKWSFGAHEADTMAERVVRILAEIFDRPATSLLRPAKNICEVTCSSTDLAALFGHWFGNGCGDKRIPLQALSWSPESQNALIRGYYDGDGHESSGVMTAFTVSETLAYGVFALGIQAGKVCSLNAIPARRGKDGVRHKKAYAVHVLNKESLRGFFAEIEGTSYFWSEVREARVARDEPTPVVDIATTGSHTFLTKMGITHNCQRGGDSIRLVSELKNLSFVEAVSYLADRSGIELEYEGTSTEEARAARERNERRRSGYRVLAAAAAYYHKYLSESSSEAAENARRYLYNRGISDSTIKEFRLGFAPTRGSAGFLQVASRVLPDVDRKTLDESGLLSPRGGERFAGRITFPISDRRGRIVGFGARALGDSEPKYLNSPETGLFNKRDLLYGFPQVAEGIRKQGAALVVEGYTDVLMLYQHGITNAVATLGTAMTPSHIKTLGRDADKVYAVFDPDEAGERATERIHKDDQLLVAASSTGLDLRLVQLSEDPADWLRNNSAEEFLALLEKAIPILEYSVNRIVKRTSGSTAIERSRAVPELRDLVQKIDDRVLYLEAIRLASDALGVDQEVFKVLQKDSKSAVKQAPEGHRISEESSYKDPLVQAGREALALILTRPDLATKPLREGVPAEGGPVTLSPDDFIDEAQAEVFIVLREHVDGDLGDSLSDERLRSNMDLVSSLSMQGERLYPSEASIRVAWLRLRILRREREKRHASDFDLKYQLHAEIQGLQRSLREAEAAAS